MSLLVAGIATVCATLFLMLKLDIRKLLAFDFIIDAAMTVALLFMYAGTFAGMFVAAISAAIFSVVLFVLKKTIGYKRLTRRGWVEMRPSWASKQGEKSWDVSNHRSWPPKKGATN